jgi:NSS family neurotransmitter:Na+ symporter
MLRDGTVRGTRWSSHQAFVIAAIGATLGLGNAWRFPGLVAEHGGLAFVAVYLVVLGLLGLPLLLAELVLARRVTGALPVHFPAEVRLSQAAPAWRAWPWLVMVAAWMVLACLLVTGSWLLGYLAAAFQGGFANPTPRAVALRFDALASAPTVAIGWLTLFLGSAVAVSAAGVRRSVEHAAWGGLVLAGFAWGTALIGVLVDGEAGAGFARLYTFDPSALGGVGLVAALTQAFYTLTLGVGVMHAYATHLPPGGALPMLAWRIVLADTLFALLATLVVLGLLAAAGLEPATGPRLLFERLPLAFARVRRRLAGGCDLFRPGGAGLADHAGAARAPGAGAVIVAPAGPCPGGVAGWCQLVAGHDAAAGGLRRHAGGALGRQGPYGWLEFLGGRLLTPLAALLAALFVGWQLEERSCRLVLALVPEPLYRAWRVLLRYLVTGILPGR